MTKEEKDITPAQENSEITKATVALDLRGEACPYPAIYIGARLERMITGEVLEILADGMCAIEGIPAAVSQSGHKLLGVEKIDSGVYRFRIEVL
jgi:TusA-related sulfurtransferase